MCWLVVYVGLDMIQSQVGKLFWWEWEEKKFKKDRIRGRSQDLWRGYGQVGRDSQPELVFLPALLLNRDTYF
jgi:hypothetical protein